MMKNRTWNLNTRKWSAGMLGVWLAVFGCASAPRGVADHWPAEKNAIELKVKADSQLNRYEDKAHTLVVCVYQLKSMKTFDQMSREKESAYRMVACNPFNDTVVAQQRFIFHPGEMRTITLDRAEHAQFVGVVAGYYEAKPQAITTSWRIPLLIYEEGPMIFKDRYRWPEPLKTELILDPMGIREREASQ
jgi:type VI secretion system VasD/TssJ family lipoprotein